MTSVIIVNILVKQILYEYFKLQLAYIGRQYKMLKSKDYFFKLVGVK